MNPGTFDDVVLFEMPSQDAAEWLWLRLQHTRGAWLHEVDETYYVAAVVRDEPEDLALLLREVESWLVETALPELFFDLDDRRYVMFGAVLPLAAAVT